MSILLSEGRKEDLKKKYSGKFKEYSDTLEFVLGISDLADSNHKYTDFVLKNLHPNSSTDEIEDAVELVKDFEQFSNKLEIKDINQYKSFEQLQDVIHRLKEVKGPKPESERIYEDDTFLVLKPKNEVASCKYGAKTKWCVTSLGSGHFQRYTSGNQELYFIINKKNSTDDYYSKVAVHVDNSGRFSYWDSKDNRMDNREVKVLEYAFPELMNSIKDDFNSKTYSRLHKFANEVFQSYSSGEYASDSNYLGSDASLEVYVEGFDTVNGGVDDGHSIANLTIALLSNGKHEILDSYAVFIMYQPNEPDQIKCGFNFDGIDPSKSWNYIDLGLQTFSVNTVFKISDTPSETARGIRTYLAKRILTEIRNNPELIKKVKGGGTFWRPNRASYGYTFRQNKGLVKKLVDYLDAGTIGTKLDFLEFIGKIKPAIENGKKVYPPSIRGYFSSFFASAKLAGILSYRKVGNQYLLTKGPNFESFKSGELKAL